jgi:hypothetical protein
MVKCPYCDKEFDVQATLTSTATSQAQPKQKWYFSTHCFVVALLCVGPFALPLMWFNPRYKPITKIIVSVTVLVLTIWLYREVKSAWNLAQQQLGGMDLGY